MSISKTVSQAESRETLAQMEKLRQRAARQAKSAQAQATDVPMVECLVLHKGDGLISMGEHFGGIGDASYEEGEKPMIELPIAVSLYDKGYVNFEGAKQASEDAKEARLKANRDRRDAEARARDEARDAD